MNIYPIKTEADYDQALAEVELLWGAEENTEKGDKLDILLVLIENYEKIHHPIDPPDPIEAIKFRMEQMGLSRKELEKCLGSKSRVSEILNYRRSLSIDMIRKLHAEFYIPLESLINKTEHSI